MRKKRTYILAFSLLLIIMGMTPWVDGLLFEKKYLHFIEVVNQDKRIKIEVLSYKVGWLNSSAKIRLTVINRDLTHLKQLPTPPFNLSLPLSFILEQDINHGPLIYDNFNHDIKFGRALIHSTLSDDTKYAAIMQVDIFSGFNSKWSGQFSIPMLSFSMQSISKIIVKELNGDFSIQMDDDYIKGIKTNMQIESLTGEGDANNSFFTQFATQSIKCKYNAVNRDGGLWSGNSSIFTPGITIHRPDGSDFILDKFAITSAFTVGMGVFYNTSLSIRIQNIKSPSYTIPAFSQLLMRVSVKNFSVQKLTEYINFMKSKSPEDLQNIDIKTVETLLAHTITPTSVFDGDITSDTSLGAFAYQSETTWPEKMPLPNSFDDIITNSYTKVDIRLSPSLVEKLIAIYGDQITATSAAQVLAAQNKVETMQKRYFVNQDGSNDFGFKQEVAQLLKEERITIPVSLQILEFEKRHQAMDIFSRNIDQLGLAPDISNRLKSIYQLQINAAVNKNAEIKTQKAQTSRLTISDLLSIGYLRKDNEDYISTLTLENGVWNINGSPI